MRQLITHICGHDALYECPTPEQIKRMGALETTRWRLKFQLLKASDCPKCYPQALERELWSGYLGQAEPVGEPDIICER